MTNHERQQAGDAQRNPYEEPPNSTVDDWLGQRVERDAELADRLVQDTGGDEGQAERLFDQISDEKESYEETHEQDR
jgi:hypothetical protein